MSTFTSMAQLWSLGVGFRHVDGSHGPVCNVNALFYPGLINPRAALFGKKTKKHYIEIILTDNTIVM